ncbi:hypothetical protein FSP39_002988 [Pinctada imbricata]|uniref:Globin domain-containing protein n=1 Tax=Pinctada imbricata TaxID=66713 RepID=A0AA89C0K8_PINIB|nr:hypothetical protein FSP39_002988 [Pinctada imbricata]
MQKTQQKSTGRDAKGTGNVNTQHRNIKHKGLHINQRDQWATGADLGWPSATGIIEGVVILDYVRTTLPLFRLPRGLEEHQDRWSGLSSLKRFGQGPSWSPVVTVWQSASFKNALVQDCRVVITKLRPSADIRIISTVQWQRTGSEQNGREEVPDPVTGLLPSEIDVPARKLESTFRKEHRKKNAIELFMILFQDPNNGRDAQNLFAELKDVPTDKLRTNKTMAGHAVTVFHAIDSFMEYIEDSDTLVELVKKQAINHIIWLIPVIKKLLDQVLEDDCTEKMKSSWEKFLGVLVAVTESCEKEMAK